MLNRVKPRYVHCILSFFHYFSSQYIHSIIFVITDIWNRIWLTLKTKFLTTNTTLSEHAHIYCNIVQVLKYYTPIA